MTPKNLVAVRLSGGLGNQMFSYAVGLALAQRLNGDLRFDTRHFRNPHVRPSQLSAFGIKVREWTPVWWRAEAAVRKISGGRWRPGPTRLIERSDFEPEVMHVSAPCYLKGYFQSWRYLHGAEDVVRAAFDTGRLSTTQTAPMEARIAQAECPVMVHVRRGDYTRPPQTYALLEINHYERARSRLSLSGTRPTYFLFSDDPIAATAMLKHWPDVVPVPGYSNLEDFRLMSLCRHFIIANSSFSWWAAWLGGAADKQVIAPNIWFAQPGGRAVDLDARLPPSWTRV